MLRSLLQIDVPAAPPSSWGVISISRGEERRTDSSPSTIERETDLIRKADEDEGRDEAADVSSDPEQDLLGPRNIVAR